LPAITSADEARMSDEATPVRDLLNRSGVPFQLAVESAIDALAPKHGIDRWYREVPSREGFIDIVARKDHILFAFECKRVDDKPWVFVMPDEENANETRCRLMWFNGHAPEPRPWFKEWSRVFCCEWNIVEPSPQAAYCVVAKDTPIRSLEAVCSELLKNCHDLLADESIARGYELVPIVPVIVTNALLKVCRVKGSVVPIETGKIAADEGNFADVDLVRFRKSLANQRSNWYDSNPLLLPDWVVDRERTVFVARPEALGRLFHGFRSFTATEPDGLPAAFTHPPPPWPDDQGP
jgi:hypothetical protein